MTRKQQYRLLELHENGYDIHINNGYVCENIYAMHKNENTGEVKYDDDVFTDCGLDDVADHYVDVYFKIEDWEDCDINHPIS